MPRSLGLLLGVLLLASACDSADPVTPPPGASSSYVGTLAGAGTSGALTIDVDGEEASGTLALAETAKGGSTPSLAGTYAPDTGALHLEGGGYTFDGTISGNVLSGTWTGPGGTSGTFTCYLGGAEGDPVRVYCGGYTSTQGGGDGTLNIVTRGTGLVGVAYEDGGDATALEGTVSGHAVTVAVHGAPGVVVATGTLSADFGSLTGSFDNQQGNTGAWSAALCN